MRRSCAVCRVCFGLLLCVVIVASLGCSDNATEGESCPDDMERVESEDDCLQGGAVCFSPGDGVWCTRPGDDSSGDSPGDSPVLSEPDEPLETDQDSSLTFVVDGTPGADADTLTVDVTESPARGTVDPQQGTAPLELTYIPDDGYYGEDTLEVTGTDDQGNTTESLTLTITVHQVNTPPHISTIPDQRVEPQGTTGPVAFTVSDEETPAEDLQVSAESLDPDVVGDEAVTLGGSGENRTIEVAFDDEYATATIRVSVSDGEASTDTEFDVEFLDFCPLMTYDCATGCCPTDSHVVSQTDRAEYPTVDVDDNGNVYMTFAHLSASYWGTGLAVYWPDTGQWGHHSYGAGNTRPDITVGSSGRIHHSYGRRSGSVYYQYSDDQGESWTSRDGIPGTLKIGGTCTLSSDGADEPHLLCGMETGFSNQGQPRYYQWEGSDWVASYEDVDVNASRQITMHIGYQDRPHVVDTYGPTDSNLHYSYRTDEWHTEAVPVPDDYEVFSPSPHPGFALGDDDEVHVGVGVRDDDGDYHVMYGRRSLDPDTGVPEWTFEVVIPNEDLSTNAAGNTTVALDADGNPVVGTTLEAIAFQDDNGDWQVIDLDFGVEDLAVHNEEAYVVYSVDSDVSTDRHIHLSVVELIP